MEIIDPEDPRLYASNLMVEHALGTTYIFAPLLETLPTVGVNVVSPALELLQGVSPVYALIEDGEARLVHRIDGEFHAEATTL